MYQNLGHMYISEDVRYIIIITSLSTNTMCINITEYVYIKVVCSIIGVLLNFCLLLCVLRVRNEYIYCNAKTINF